MPREAVPAEIRHDALHDSPEVAVAEAVERLDGALPADQDEVKTALFLLEVLNEPLREAADEDPGHQVAAYPAGEQIEERHGRDPGEEAERVEL